MEVATDFFVVVYIVTYIRVKRILEKEKKYRWGLGSIHLLLMADMNASLRSIVIKGLTWLMQTKFLEWPGNGREVCHFNG